MQQFIEEYAEHITGTLWGFDRLVFRASPRRLNSSYYDANRGIVVAKGMEEYLWQNQVLFKDYGNHVRRVSERIKQHSLQPFHEANLPVVFLRDPNADKDLLARGVAAERGIRSGLVCAISTVQPSPTFEYAKSRIARRIRPAHVLPKGFVRIRHFGYLANRFRASQLPLCRQLLAMSPPEPRESPNSSQSPSTWHCPHCGAAMVVAQRLTAAEV